MSFGAVPVHLLDFYLSLAPRAQAELATVAASGCAIAVIVEDGRDRRAWRWLSGFHGRERRQLGFRRGSRVGLGR
ncbi:hypothetical protein CDL15_Pgr026384 [Punica granatum]|uniref:Uncharacterized protein n=1 Tax=Punica granatum TaxID=22663 RepID=A0A218XQF4_PUNGR|nr:hypothetical protein CDL15_Pgr026384 [Punica granatum]PKI75043.1 hypothetical protein CRG98_004517 [Punica granatum]